MDPNPLEGSGVLKPDLRDRMGWHVPSQKWLLFPRHGTMQKEGEAEKEAFGSSASILWQWLVPLIE